MNVRSETGKIDSMRGAPEVTSVAVITTLERLRREAAVAESVHSAALEGQQVTLEMLADSDAYARGEIDVDELGRRTRSRYGLG